MVKCLSILLFFWFPFIVIAQKIDLQSGPDIAFNGLENILMNRCEYPNDFSALSLSQRIDFFKCDELKRMAFRREGLKLWDAFKKDPRRYDWFFRTVQDERLNMYYWKNIESGAYACFSRTSVYSSYTSPIDWVELNLWNRRYSKMKKEFFVYLEGMQKDGKKESEIYFYKYNVLLKELEGFLKLSLNKGYRMYKKINLNVVSERFRNVAKEISAYESKNTSILTADEKMVLTEGIKRAMDNDFIACYDQLGLTSSDVIGFIKSLKDDMNPIVREWSVQRNSLFALRRYPLELKGFAIDGREIDLRKSKGKVVLIDIWSTKCSSCIARMPAIKQIYDKYKNQGFEVISVCFNNGDELSAIKQIEKKIDTDWPILMAGGVNTNIESRENSLAGQLFKKYGFFGVPQLLLLDKKGELVLLNDILRFGDFEPIVKKLLTDK